MTVDLNVLWNRCTRLSTDGLSNERTFWSYVKRWAREGDLLCYGLYVHGSQHPSLRDLCFSPHAWLAADSMEKHTRSLTVAHPGSGKTALARWRVEQWLGMETELAFDNPDHTVPSALYLMAKFEGQAEDQVLEIRNTVEKNRRYRELFPRARPDKSQKWEKGAWFLKRPEGKTRPEPTLKASGIGGDIQGARFGLLVCDDPIDQRTAQSPTQVRQATQFLLATFESRVVDENTPIVYRFTRWHERDAFNALSRSCHTLVMPIYGFWEQHPEHAYLWKEHPKGPNPPDVLWAGMWSRERAEAERQKLIDSGEAALWQLVWMCNPRAAEGGIIKREWLHHGPSPLQKEEAVAV